MCVVEEFDVRTCAQASYKTTWFVRLISEIGGHARIGGPVGPQLVDTKQALRLQWHMFGWYLFEVQ